jgi:hypothetical protein
MNQLCVALLAAVALACAGRPQTDPNVTRLFDNPERVTILGYDDDAMEPFITRDGRYLLFNNLNEPTVNPGISKQKAGIVNFDVDISPDGNTMYFVDGTFGNGGPPKAARLVIAERSGTEFWRRADGDVILHNVNSDALQYAACISADGLSLFFNRTRTGPFG